MQATHRRAPRPQATRRALGLTALAALGLSLGLCAAAPRHAQAQAFNNNVGLLGAHSTVTFNTAPAGLSDGDRLNTQFAAQGVSFSGGGPLGVSGLFYDSTNRTGANSAGGAVGFGGAYIESVGPAGNVTNGPFTITFTGTVDAAAIAVLDQGNSYTFDALLNGVVVDSATGVVAAQPGSGFVGFRNELFNAIRVSRVPGGGDTAIAFDTLQFRAAAAVPEPGTCAAA